MSEIKVKRIDVANLVTVLATMNGSYDNKLKYAIKRNKDLLSKEYAVIQAQSQTKVEKFVEYENKRTALINEYALRDENGSMVFENQNSVKLQQDKVNEFNVKINDLSKEYEDTLKAKFEEEKIFRNYLQEEVDVTIYEIDNSIIPSDIDQEKYEILYVLIKTVE